MRYILLLSLVFALLPVTLKSQQFSHDDIILIERIDEILKQYHIDYSKLKNKVPDRFFQIIVFELDPKAQILTQQEISEIKEELIGYMIYPTLTEKILRKLHAILLSRINSTLTILSSINQIDFFTLDSLKPHLQKNLRNYAKNDQELKTYWTQSFKYHALLKSHQDTLLDNADKETINLTLTNKVLEDRDANICYLQNIRKKENLDRYILNAFLKAYCQSFDPHTNYLSHIEEKAFKNDLSSRMHGTGISYMTDGSKYFIAAVNVFSEASKYPEIAKGDEIIRVGIEGEMIHPSCIDPESLNDLFYGESHQYLDIELRSTQDFQYRTFHILKGNVNNLSNHLYSFILQKHDFKLGYILFPTFYTRFSDEERSSAEDLALVLISFKEQKLDGVIVDMRNNGGGSIGEAADFLSYFIDYGPLFTIADKETPKGMLMKDTRRGKVNMGKTIFLVNEYSASATEIVAATMRNYPNTLIVGSQTFGKATGQVMVPIETQPAQNSTGTVTVTNLKVFEFNGSNYQGSGVIPDIVLPSLLSKSILGEKQYDNILKHGDMRGFQPVAERNEPIDRIIKRFNQRNSLSELEDSGKSIEKFLTNEVSLYYSDFENPFVALSEIAMDTASLPYEIKSFESDESYNNLANKLIVNKSMDPIIYETFLIFEDWIDLTNTN